ncbi:MAG TPA: sn-glycerol-3-phosphate ABC transporter ATP-binding protein UgpC [Armatimonadota bacterium]|jgi:multiple sugar transport system ATP-binding protein
MATVTLKELTKSFKTITAVNKMNLDIKDGEFMVFVGPSGCGKTTALRMIAGLEEPTDGEIYIGERLVNDVSPKDRDIAMVFQNYALYPHMTVFDNMAFGLKLRKVPRQEIKTRVDEVARMLGLEQLLDRKPKALSGGQRQRVALGRAIVRQPLVFLMDEPLSNLDAKLRVQTRSEIIKLHRRLGVTTIYVTHDQVEAMTMGDRITVMKDGVIQQVDSPLSLYNQPVNMFVAGFIGSPAMNFVYGKVEDEGGAAVFNAGAIKVKPVGRLAESLKAYVGKEIVWGVRPSDIFAKVTRPDLVNGTGNEFTALVDVREIMGDRAYLYLMAGNHPIVADVDSETPLKEQANTDFVVDIDRTHAFDRETEQAIF